MTKRWLQPLNRGGRLIGVFIEYFTDNDFGTSTTGRLIEVQLYSYSVVFLWSYVR